MTLFQAAILVVDSPRPWWLKAVAVSGESVWEMIGRIGGSCVYSLCIFGIP